ncbi:MAG TPA: hypothetical protein PK718_03945 [Candidatus Methanofastidiosa archaeon]|nr:hypothetical protein [Candidatus Methanofastidiosa archaeon]HPR41685.1 hypothetical protein [Candidatus Methanofastidiosa archaeon]
MNIGEKDVLQRCDHIKARDWKRISSRAAIISLILVVFILLTGGSLNPTLWPQQFERRVDPTSLLEIDKDTLAELEGEFVFFKRNMEDGSILPCFAGQVTIFHDIYCFTSHKIAYVKDQSLYYSLDYLAKPGEILSKGADDCDGKAVLICTMLLKRGYDAYVVMGTEHTWVEVDMGDSTVYISYLGSENPVLITGDKMPDVNTTYVKFNSAETDWMPLGLVMQGSVVFFYTFAILMIVQLIYINRLYEGPARVFSEMFGYFSFILYMVFAIFIVWVLILLLIKYLSLIQ